jgi:hypothetical protein
MVPTRQPPVAALTLVYAAAIVESCRGIFETRFNEDAASWWALGADFHGRLEKN